MRKQLLKKTVLFLFWSIVILQLLIFLLNDDANSFTRIMMHELYNQEENIEVLFLGSSHVRQSIDSNYLTKKLGGNVFNAGSPMQSMDTSLALLNEVLKNHEVKEVYLEMYYGMMFSEEYHERKDVITQYLVADYMKLSFNKVEFLLQASAPEHWMNSFIIPKRNIMQILSWKHMRNMIVSKSTKTYLSYNYPSGKNEEYQGKGFVYSEVSTNLEEMMEKAVAQVHMNPSQDYMNSLYDIIEICKEKGINLVLFASPITEYHLENCGGYDDCVEAIQDWIRIYEIPYYDFNLCKEEVLELKNAEFTDSHHLKGRELRNLLKHSTI